MSKRFSRDKILRSVATPRPWFRVDKEKEVPEIFIYDQIGLDWWGDGISPNDFKDELLTIEEKAFNLHINSPGGFVYDGLSIYNLLNRIDKTITVYIDGLAASIASVIAMAGDTIIMPENAEILIHDPWSLVIGNSTNMRKEADELDQIKESILGIYVARTGADRAILSKMMIEETSMNGDEAYDLGFVDQVEENKKLAACGFNILFANNTSNSIQNRFDANQKRKLEADLRDVGYSRSVAKAIASGPRDVVPVGNPRDAGNDSGIKKTQTILIV